MHKDSVNDWNKLRQFYGSFKCVNFVHYVVKKFACKANLSSPAWAAK
jgi:hypothetical protein